MSDTTTRPTIPVPQIVASLRASGVERGDHLAIGVSLKAVGCGPDDLIAALIEAVGPTGTVMANTYTALASDEPGECIDGDDDALFDPATTEATTGAVPNRMRRWAGAIRSTHPSNSVVAIGAMAARITDGHNADAGAYSPYSRLAELGGKFLALGVGDALVGLRHEAQSLAGLLTVVPCYRTARYRDAAGQVRLFRRTDRGGCVARLPELVGELRAGGGVIDGRVGGAASVLVDANTALRHHVDRLRAAPERYLCEIERCTWCRELERRLNLYDRIERPLPFQSSRLWRAALAMENRYLLRDRRPPWWIRRIRNVLRRIGSKLGR